MVSSVSISQTSLTQLSVSVCVVQLPVPSPGHPPHDLHMHICTGRRAAHHRQKQGGVCNVPIAVECETDLAGVPLQGSWACSGCLLGSVRLPASLAAFMCSLCVDSLRRTIITMGCHGMYSNGRNAACTMTRHTYTPAFLPYTPRHVSSALSCDARLSCHDV